MTSQLKSKGICFVYFALYIGISTWIHGLTTEAEETCGQPGRTALSVFVPSYPFSVGTRIQYSCTNLQNVLLGNNERQCLANGTWSGDIPVCSRIAQIKEVNLSSGDAKAGGGFPTDGNITTCSDVRQSIWEGRVADSSNIFAVKIILKGAASISLQVSVKHDNKDIQTVRDCNSGSTAEPFSLIFYCPPNTTGNYIQIKSNYHGLTFTICEVFVLLKPAQQCLMPDKPTNGYGFRVSHWNEMEYRFKCNEGYKRWGALSVFCRTDGKWSPNPPKCEKIYCLRPSQPKDGTVKYDLIKEVIPYNGTAVYSCDEGFILQGNSTLRCFQFQAWDFPVPECKKRTSRILNSLKDLLCSTVPYIPNGALVVNSTSIGSVARLQCDEGFESLTNVHISCLPTGEWSSLNLSCSVIQCETNPVVPHGAAILLNDSSRYGSFIQIKCSKGYTTQETFIRKCGSSGSWGDLNVCTAITCGSFTRSEDDGGEWVYLNDSQSIKILVCPHGFHIEGSPPVSRCLSNGSWSYTSAICKNPSENEDWRNPWTPSLILIAAVAVGAGTAISILCLSVALFVARKRRQSRIRTTVFHLDNVSHPEGAEISTIHRKKYHSASEQYQAAIEQRPKTNYTNLRKPHSALPNLPMEADPVYAQPFETATATKKPLTANTNKKDELFNAHIYAEPVDSRLSSCSSNMLINDLYSRPETDSEMLSVRMDSYCETPLGIMEQLPKQKNCDKQCAIYDSTNISSLNNEKLNTLDEQFLRTDEKNILNSLTKNSEYSGLL